MPRSPYPPHDFECLYRHSCPYLDGLSTKWVLGEYRRAGDVYQEHLRIIDGFDDGLKIRDDRIRVLERENAELRAKLQALHQRQFRPNKKKEAETGGKEVEGASSSNEGKKKKRGAPLGHPGWVRPKPDRIDRTVHVPAPTICPHCQSEELRPMEESTEHFQEDILIRPQTRVTRYLHGQAFCTRCHRPVVQAGEDELLNAPIGPVAKSLALYLRYRIGIPYRKTAELFRELFGLKFVPASALGFDRKAVVRGRPIYEDLREKIRASDVIHADETSWRSDGVGHFVWFAGNENLAFFHIDRHRSAEVAKTIFGEDFNGTLVRDWYAAYNGIGVDWQVCIAHIITKAKEISAEHALLPQTEKDAATGPFCDRVMDLGSRLCDAGQKLKSGDIPWKAAAKIEKRFVTQLSNLCKRPLRFKPAETLRAYLAGPEQKFLFTFLRRPGVPPTNNHAEQSLRPLVIFRKICFGTRSESGLKTHSILPSLVQTARRQGVHPRKFLQTLLTADTATAQAALYNNSS
ncbi:MAG: IS66 family transposase [Thermodesulfobacteriota bacterium]